jgi:hypothetical protein
VATWKPAPSVTAQAAGGDGPGTGKFPPGVNHVQLNIPPTPNFIAAPATSSGNDGTDVFTTG